MNNYYNKNLREYASELRTETVSKAEKFIWKSLLSKNKQGVKFKRQRPIHYYIVDFFAQEIGLIVEIDGNSHYHKPEYDARRQKELESLGYTFLRFKEGEVLNDLGEVARQIEHAVYCLKRE
ncbi:MAG TPA: endonuclease domain-containing protein [Candidatus Dojkabacteria bacterium]|nr:endonuclease domain-containing protein [Candidatus Dojkabacteria bacterium]